MKKLIKMVLYAEPGTGKSVFALGFPKPFFITTDGNYSWLEAFGAKEENHKQVLSWNEAKKEFNKPYDEYETIVVDLVEDLFKWCESEFCERNRIEHISECGYGKGYDITRSDFTNELIKLIGKDKNVILLSHANSISEKNARGIEKTIYIPSNRIPDKVWAQLEGRVQFFCRAYLTEEVKKDDETGEEYIINKRMISLVKKPEERYSVIRNVNENSIPRDIPLDYKTFINTIENNLISTKTTTVKEVKKVEVVKPAIKKVESVKPKTTTLELKVEKEELEPEPEPKPATTNPIKVHVVKEVPVEKPESKPTIQNGNDKLAAMKAKLAALKAMKK